MLDVIDVKSSCEIDHTATYKIRRGAQIDEKVTSPQGQVSWVTKGYGTSASNQAGISTQSYDDEWGVTFAPALDAGDYRVVGMIGVEIGEVVVYLDSHIVLFSIQ